MTEETQNTILTKLMLYRGATTASQVTYISNSNKNFCELEKLGICKSKKGKLGNSHVKWRSIRDVNKAVTFLNKRKVKYSQEKIHPMYRAEVLSFQKQNT